MKPLCESLKNQFTIFNLGCIGDADYQLPRNIVGAMTVIEADAEGRARTRSRYYRKIQITTPIAGAAGKRPFFRNTFAGTCSLLRPRPGKVQEFGMEQYFDGIGASEMECETIPELLRREGISTLDFLKTDVEGLDSDIIRSCEKFFGHCLGFQAELRFDPFYQSEPYFHETVSLLANHGYEVLDIVHIDRWKYRTSHWKWQLAGRAIWADFIFFLKPDRLVANFGEEAPLAVCKQVILACMLGKKNYGEWLLQRFDKIVPLEWKQELQPLVRPRLLTLTQLRQLVRRQLMPLELFLKHRINRSRHVSIRLSN